MTNRLKFWRLCKTEQTGSGHVYTRRITFLEWDKYHSEDGPIAEDSSPGQAKDIGKFVWCRL